MSVNYRASTNKWLSLSSHTWGYSEQEAFTRKQCDNPREECVLAERYLPLYISPLSLLCWNLQHSGQSMVQAFLSPLPLLAAYCKQLGTRILSISCQFLPLSVSFCFEFLYYSTAYQWFNHQTFQALLDSSDL
jgi:hypothetical protein